MTGDRYGLLVHRVRWRRWRWCLYRYADEATWVGGEVYRDPGSAWGAAIAHLHRWSRAPASATTGTKPVVIDRRTWQGSFTVPKEQP